MHSLIRIVMLGVALQASFFAPAIANQDEAGTIEMAAHREAKEKHGHCDCYGPVGPQGEIGPQGDPRLSYGSYASFFLTTDSGGVDVTPGENVIFNNQVALSGIQYDSTTGVFTLGPGTYVVAYFFAPFSIPSVNMYVNDKLILNSPLSGSSTVLTLRKETNTLVLQYIFEQSFASPGANESWASIAISQIN